MSSVGYFASEFGAAIRFLTRLPWPPAQASRGFGVGAFPLVGLLLGLVALVVDYLLRGLAGGVRDVAIVAVLAIATGGLHYDGLADTLDALGGATRADRLRIMRDGAIGTFGALGVVLVVAVELAALGALSGRPRAAALFAAPALGRWAMVATGFRAPSARAEGLGALFASEITPGALTAATVAMLVIVTVLGGGGGLVVALALVLMVFLLRRFATLAFGGVTGDTLGACGLLAEAVAFALWSSR